MGDLADQANADAEADLHIRLHQSDAHLLRAIEDALARIAQERFGVCEICSSPISKARLEAVPWTRLCRDCISPISQFSLTKKASYYHKCAI
jgi:DnaK suppressor protein